MQIAYALFSSVYALSHRRTIVALAQWRAGRPLVYHRYVDETGSRELLDPAEVDWSGFPPSDAGPGSANY